ncbi:MAG TPA: sialidase family protein [Mycobacteriales bacterium]|nr:sialidase family protein [Mycobacteriales bacterium]
MTGLRSIEAVGSGDLVGLWSSLPVSPGRGWLATSTDGGHTWHEAGTMLPVGLRGYAIPSLAFASPRVGAVLVAGKVITTDDGGTTWQTVGLPGRVLELTVKDEIAWALSESCQGSQCVLLVSTNALGGADTWTPTTPLPYEVSRYFTPTLVASSGQTAMLDPSESDVDQLAEVTDDGGRHWRVAGPPCGAKTPVRVRGRTVEMRWEELEALASDLDGRAREWWAVCGGGAAAGTETKGIELSSDEGGTWFQAAAFPSIAPYRNPQDLPAGDFEGLTALRNGQLLMATPNELAISLDRGASWHGAEGVNLGGASASITADARGTVWVLAPGVGLWRGQGPLQTFKPL